MSHSYRIFAFVCALGLPVAANAAYSPYFSVGGGLYNTNVHFSRGSADVSSNGLSLSATAGLRINQYLGLEVNGIVNQLRIAAGDRHNDITFVGIMPGARLGVKFMGIFYPYVGVSIGPSFVLNEASYDGTSQSHTTTSLAYQARAGLMFSLGGGAGLDIGVRYQNQGRLNISSRDFAIDGQVNSFNYYITASYGF